MAMQITHLDGALARALAGDESGFVELWRQLNPRLLRYLRVLSCDDADDVASETWLQVVRDLAGFAGQEEDFRRWLFTVGRHRAIDAARARTRHRTRPMPDSGLELLADHRLADHRLADHRLADHRLVEDQVLDSMSVTTALALVARLSQDQAEAVALRVIADLDTAAVAGILGKSPGAVRVALHRGLRALAADPAVQSLASGPGRLPPSAAPGPGGRPPAATPGPGRPPAAAAGHQPPAAPGSGRLPTAAAETGRQPPTAAPGPACAPSRGWTDK
jgi:RNA polymerase sigma-70 factor (ECF subfamily)